MQPDIFDPRGGADHKPMPLQSVGDDTAAAKHAVVAPQRYDAIDGGIPLGQPAAQQLDGLGRQWYAVQLALLGRGGRLGPYPGIEIEIGPAHTEHHRERYLSTRLTGLSFSARIFQLIASSNRMCA